MDFLRLVVVSALMILIGIDAFWIKEMEGTDFEGDMVLDKEQTKALKKVAAEKRASIIGRRWPLPIQYVTDERLLKISKAMEAIKASIDELEGTTCLRFDNRTGNQTSLTNNTGYIFFHLDTHSCNAYVGYHRGRNIINLAPPCFTKGLVLHEIGHGLGLYHEHSRPDRDEYITIIKANMERVLTFNLKGHLGGENITLYTSEYEGVKKNLAQLTKKWRTFTIPNVQSAHISLNGDNKSSIVLLLNAIKYVIDFKDQPTNWNCSSQNPSTNCTDIQGGIFRWPGNYLIHNEMTKEDKLYNLRKREKTEIDSLGTPYDYSSIMHYTRDAFKDGKEIIRTNDCKYSNLIGRGSSLSKIDIKQINLMYNCQEKLNDVLKSDDSPIFGTLTRRFWIQHYESNTCFHVDNCYKIELSANCSTIFMYNATLQRIYHEESAWCLYWVDIEAGRFGELILSNECQSENTKFNIDEHDRFIQYSKDPKFMNESCLGPLTPKFDEVPEGVAPALVLGECPEEKNI